MSQTSYPWTGESTGDCGPYSATDISDWNYLFSMTAWAAEGVLLSDGSVDGNLEVTGTSSPVAVDTGRAIVRARFYESTASENVTISTPSSQPRYDRIVLRSDYTAQTIRIAKLTGSEGGGVPTLTQIDGTTWETPIATCYITTGGAITVTDERTFCHMRTMVSTDQLDDDVLSADSTGLAKMEDGFLSADTAGRAKMEDDYIVAAKLADGVLSADETGRAKMADDFITEDHLSEDIDGASHGLSALYLSTRKAMRDWIREDGSPSSFDDEFDDGELAAKWTAAGSCSASGEELDDHASFYIGKFNGSGQWIHLIQDVTGGSQYSLTVCYSWGIRNDGSYCTLEMFDSADEEGMAVKLEFDDDYATERKISFMDMHESGWSTVSTRRGAPINTRVMFMLRADGTGYTAGWSTDGVSYHTLGDQTKVFSLDHVRLYMYFGTNNNTQPRGIGGIDWFRKDYDYNAI